MEPAARKQKILSAIVERYIRSGEPVGSKSLLADAGLKVSQLTPVSEHGRATIRDTLSAGADSPESILQCAAELLARLTDGVALTTTPDGDAARVRRISFVSTGAHGGMAVVIASNGAITTRLFRCEFLLTPEILHVFDKALNETFAGVLLGSVNRPFVQTAAAGFGELSLFMTSPLMAVMEACAQAAQVNICRSGYDRLINAADGNPQTARRIWEFLQNGHDLAAMLGRVGDDRRRKQPHRAGQMLGDNSALRGG